MNSLFSLSLLFHTLAAIPALQAPLPPVTLVGRFVAETPYEVRFAWPNSAIGGRFYGTSLAVRLSEVGDATEKTSPMTNLFDVRIDGGAPITIELVHGQTLYPITTHLAPGAHTVWLRKRTEAFVGSCRFWGFDAGPQGRMLSPPPAHARRLLFFGASNETGYGNAVSHRRPATCAYTPSTQDAGRAYPQLTADALGAEAINVAYAGRGLLRNFAPDAEGSPPAPRQPDLFDLADPNDPTLAGTAQPPPDAVVVDAGGNDFNQGTPPRDAFVVAYVDLLRHVRALYPQAQIYGVMGPMQAGAERDTMRSYVQAAIGELAQTDPRVDYFEFAAYTGSTFGCDGHPDSLLHQAMATQLTQTLAPRLGW